MQDNIPLSVRTIINACRRAERQILKDYVNIDSVEMFDKGLGRGVCTSTDIAVEAILKAELSRSQPGCGFICEEGGSSVAQGSDLCYIIDPIDGTSNFIKKLPFFAISVALAKSMHDGTYDILAGVIYAPIMREIYWATKGHKAFVETDGTYITKVRCGNRRNLDNSVISFTSSFFRYSSNYPAVIGKCMAKRASIRIFGSAALCMAYVASGKTDVFVGAELKPWDIASGLLLVKEAGGVVSDHAGNLASMNNANILCCNSNLHNKTLFITKV